EHIASVLTIFPEPLDQSERKDTLPEEPAVSPHDEAATAVLGADESIIEENEASFEPDEPVERTVTSPFEVARRQSPISRVLTNAPSPFLLASALTRSTTSTRSVPIPRPARHLPEV